jgi:Peptidase C10 family/Spi protease inhibitor
MKRKLESNNTTRLLTEDRSMLNKIVLLTFAFLLFFTHAATAAEVDTGTANQLAQHFLSINNTDLRIKAALQGTPDVAMQYTASATTPLASVSQLGTVAYIIDLDPVGFVAISTETDISPIIAYSFTSNFSMDENPNNILYHMLKLDMQNRLSALGQTDQSVIQANNAKWSQYLAGDKAILADLNSKQQWPDDGGGWLDTEWGQDGIYNMSCPLDPVTGGRCITGCVATAMAQIVNYWQYPASVTFDASDNYISVYDPGNGLRTIPIDATTASMTNIDYSGNGLHPDDQTIADLMFACGVSVEMFYSDIASGAYVDDVADALTDKFGYVSAEILYPDFDSNFYDVLEGNMKVGFPVELAIFWADGSSGHAIVCDGFSDDDSFYHLNMGWDGYFDAWYDLPEGMPAGYSVIAYGIVNIQSPGNLTNDDFADSIAIPGDVPQVIGSNVGATNETDEPDHAEQPATKSVWWTWTAPSAGTVTINTFGSTFDTLLAIYTGDSVDSLTEITSNDDWWDWPGVEPNNRLSEVTFEVVSGADYRIAVDGWGGEAGNIFLNIDLTVFNDNFEDALVITGYNGQTTRNNTEATKEPGEPDHAGDAGGKSLWWEWTAPVTRTAYFNTSGSDFNTLLAVYTGGSVDSLTEITANDDSGTVTQSALSFAAVQGITYLIAVDGFGSDSGNIALNWSAPPVNDDFDSSTVITDYTGQTEGDNMGAAKEPGEPDHAGNSGGASVWWTWTAPASGPATFNTFGSDVDLDTLLAVYTGDSVDSLTLIESNDDSGPYLHSALTFPAAKGTTYRIVVDGYNWSTGADTGNIGINWNMVVTHDNFDDALTISGRSGQVTDNNSGATKETGEPDHAGNAGGKSLWWMWTAPESDTVDFDTFGSDFNTLLAVYTGDAVDSLTEVASNDDTDGGDQSAVNFEAVAGTTYMIVIDGYGGEFGNIALTWNMPPVNDDLVDAIIVTGFSGQDTGTSVGGTMEPGEPDHAGIVGGKSVWWSWTSPGSGEATVDTLGSDFDTLLAIYTGTSIDSLTPVAGNDNSGVPQSSVTFEAQAGTTYKIAVDGKAGATGDVTINWFVPFPNDNFDSANMLTGLSGQTATDNENATKEFGEPIHAGNPGGKSLWWKWVAPANLPVTFNTVGSDFDTLLGIYTGSAVASLSEVISNDNSYGQYHSSVTFAATQGETYMIAVDGYYADAGRIVLNWNVWPANDNFDSAIQISGFSGQITANNTEASKELGDPSNEPDHAGNAGGKSLWWHWTAPGSGPAVIDTLGSDFDTLLAIYTGTSYDTLIQTEVDSNDDTAGGTQSAVRFAAVAGTKYMIAVDGLNGYFGDIVLTWDMPLSNDHYDSARVITGFSGHDTAINLDASKEVDEPDHADNPGGNSLWWSWTATESATMTIDVFGSDFDVLLAVYKATGSVDCLASAIASNDDEGGGYSSFVTFEAEAETTYMIAVDGYDGAWGQIVLNWYLAVSPIDHFEFYPQPIADQGTNNPFQVTVKAVDDAGSLVTSYSDTVTISGPEGTGGDYEAVIGSGDLTWEYPFNAFHHDARTQVIYLEEEIGCAGQITSLSVHLTTVPAQTLTNFTIRMKHILNFKDEYDTGLWVDSGWTMVYQTDETIDSTGWSTFEFTTPFDYDGIYNLLVDFSFDNTDYTLKGLCRYSEPGGNRSLYFHSDSDHGDPLDWSGIVPDGNLSTKVPDVRLYIECLSAVDTPTVLITEIYPGNPDYIEIQNVTGKTFDTSGWVVAVGNSELNINAVNTLVWDMPSVLFDVSIKYKTDDDPDNYWGTNLRWLHEWNGWAIILDDEGNIVDFVAWGWTEADIQSMSVEIAGYTVNIGDEWSGDGIYLDILDDSIDESFESFSIERVGAHDFNNATDFEWHDEGSKGGINEGLSVPFSGGGDTVGMTPSTVYVQNGEVTFDVTIDGVATNFYLMANDQTGHVGQSNLFNVLLSASQQIQRAAIVKISTDPSGVPVVHIDGDNGMVVDLYASDDLVTWNVIASDIVLDTNLYLFTDLDGAGKSSRSYKLLIK